MPNNAEINICDLAPFFKKTKKFICFERERERESVQREREREGAGERESQAGSALSAQSPSWVLAL